MKRALMTFGNHFGLALYGQRSGENVADAATGTMPRHKFVADCQQAISGIQRRCRSRRVALNLRGQQTFNARARDGCREADVSREAFQRRRCIIPASGWRMDRREPR